MVEPLTSDMDTASIYTFDGFMVGCDRWLQNTQNDIRGVNHNIGESGTNGTRTNRLAAARETVPVYTDTRDNRHFRLRYAGRHQRCLHVAR